MKTNTPANIEKISFGKLNGYRMYFKSSSAQIISDLGCNLNSLMLNGQDIIDGNTDEEMLSSNYLAKSALLMPFPNRIDKGKYNFGGKTYRLPINKKAEGHAIHGLVYDKPFKLVNTKTTKTSVSASFFYGISNTQHEGYPFNLLFLVTCALESNQFTISVSGTNNGKSVLPYGVGWHPYLKTNKKIDRCKLSISSRHMLEIGQTKKMIPTGKIKRANAFNNGLMGKQRFDTCFTNLFSHKTQFENIILFQDSTMNFLQVYTPENRQSIAIEPMSCAPDAFNNKMGMISLVPLTSVTHSFGIKLLHEKH